ncbi:GNAT family N-acetyltransferase [Mesonia sp. MT50]|uniref:GNAT family N-acetyltransferase n=1 Tax=Mesonia profundi TaxID=3070998 RepID=A0ABU1A3H2_9FLAO|nr:GNAT family N-acetyltransferase [Mesonia profundi]MDQ7917488.1 GNAT family N-acetyltransferase [Mesonia profundi]
MDQSIKHKENETNGIFYLEIENKIVSELTYIKKEPNILVIDRTETKKTEEGKGLASKLLEHTVNYAKENNYKIDPLCPFAEVKFDENEAYQKIKA